VRKLVATLSAAALVLLALASFASARSSAFTAKLTASDVVPKQAHKNTSASGSFSASARGYELYFKLAFSHLSGPATGANLGYGPKGKAGVITIPLCAPCKSPVSTAVGMDKSLLRALKQHLLFVIVKTANNPNGEIRGQIGG
jgi:hypothetical protein